MCFILSQGSANSVAIVYTCIYNDSMLLIEVTECLKKSSLKFVVVGGYALALHGIVRATMDVDVVLCLTIEDYTKAEAALNSIGLQSRLPVRAQDIIKMRREYIENRNLIAWSFVDYKDPSRQVDILITKDARDLETESISLQGKKLSVVSLKALLQMKAESGRPQDLIDIENIRNKLNEKD